MRRRTSLETAQNKLIYSYNLILLRTRPLNLHTQNYFEKAAQSEELKQKPKNTEMQHTVQKIMSAEN